MEQLQKVISYFKKLIAKQSKKKIIENSVIIIIIGAIIIIAGGAFLPKEKDRNEPPLGAKGEGVREVSKTVSYDEKIEIEERLETILSQVDGVGKVDVMITFHSSKEIVPAYDTKRGENITSEKDAQGGTRNIENKDYEDKIVYQDEQGGKKPIIIKELQPQVKGVLVVADGAHDMLVREGLIKAVQVLMDVPMHKIEVLERKK